MKKFLLAMSLFAGVGFAKDAGNHLTPWEWDIKPVGKYVYTYNFPTNVAVSKNHIFVLTNGATSYQTITMYNKNTARTFSSKSLERRGKSIQRSKVFILTLSKLLSRYVLQRPQALCSWRIF